jgi:putative DNA methylase
MATRPNNASSRRPALMERSRPIEGDDFPFEFLSEVAEAESWRKEVYRPIYHVHKWWAQRLGSIFRAVVLGSAPGRTGPVMKSFYEPVDLGGLVVFDPFMGSGTTVGEAVKLGCAAVGRDINPVAYNAVRVGLGPVGRVDVDRAFRAVEDAVGADLRALYRSTDSAGRACDVLYFFWVKVVGCPNCKENVSLFSDYIFAKHAYVKKYPTVHIICPECGEVVKGVYTDTKARCCSCKTTFDPHTGPARSTTAVCPGCSHEFPIARTVRASGSPPRHRLYAKLVLTQDGEKEYVRATEDDRRAYEAAARRLDTADIVRPEGGLEEGHNTKQALNYNYRQWSDFFNDRQLLALGLLAKAIKDLPAGPARDALAIVFSGTLEFNNLFASYKGEGTGAVRHMFSHHILKPERTPIEANPWGLPQSSGAFSTLYRSRLLRAMEYREHPFEVVAETEGGRAKGNKVFGTAAPLTSLTMHDWTARPSQSGLYLSCGDSGDTKLADKSVDLVVTDPPFFDNVHYSELADFFYAWQRKLVPVTAPLVTTRQDGEVQDRSADAFASKLGRVWGECRRVLVDDGLLVFSYHHSRDDGWVSVARAVCDAGFSIVQAHPVKAEMSVATPKAQASDPIDIDILLVCRKRSADSRPQRSASDVVKAAHKRAASCLARFGDHGRRLSRNDVKVLLFSSVLREVSAGRSAEEVTRDFEALVPKLQPSIEALYDQRPKVASRAAEAPQLPLALGE